MADVKLNIAGRDYLVTCRDGEESRLETLAALVNEKAEEAGGAAQGLNESRQLLFASLLLADQLADRVGGEPQTIGTGSQPIPREIGNKISSKDLDMFEKFADRVEALADRLEP